MYILISLE